MCGVRSASWYIISLFTREGHPPCCIGWTIIWLMLLYESVVYCHGLHTNRINVSTNTIIPSQPSVQRFDYIATLLDTIPL